MDNIVLVTKIWASTFWFRIFSLKLWGITKLWYLNWMMNITSGGTNNTDIQPENYFTHFLYAYGVPVICIFGIVGNIFSFHVFAFKSFRSHSSSAYIAALSVSDSCFLLSLFFSWLSNGKFGFLLSRSTVWCHVMIFFTSVCSFLSVWYVVLIMIDRYVSAFINFYYTKFITKLKNFKPSRTYT